MQSANLIGLGTDASVLAAYAFRANDRLGNLDVIYENTGQNAAYIRVKELVGTEYTDVASPITVAAGGTLTRSYVLVSSQVGFFGSGNTTVNASFAIRGRADLRGADLSFVSPHRQGWNFAPGFNQNAYAANYDV